MPEFLTLLPPDEARTLLLSHIPRPMADIETVDVPCSLGRTLAEDILAPHPLPDFQRSTVDGYAVRAEDTHGARARTAYQIGRAHVWTPVTLIYIVCGLL